MAFQFSSSAFQADEHLPKKYTCYGDNLSPPLEWGGFPDDTDSLSLICEDTDVPTGHWIHWLIFNIPPDEPGLPEGIPPLRILHNKAIQGKNDFGDIGYGGPCPRLSVHHYHFHLFALDTMLDLSSECLAQDLMLAMDGHILDQLELIGTYGNESPG